MACHQNSYGTFPEVVQEALVSGEGYNCASRVRGWGFVCHSCTEVCKAVFEHESELFHWEQRMALQKDTSRPIVVEATGTHCCYAHCASMFTHNFSV